MPFICLCCCRSIGSDANVPPSSCPECGGAMTTSASEDGAEVPERIGRYEIRERIGSGATAEVYKGYDVGLQREVAVKVPRSHLVASQETANAFLTEARTLASLDHPNILPIFDLGRTDDGLCFLVCKLFDGRSLKDRLTRGRPVVDDSVDIVRCLAEALQHAHDHGLVHRDVKPANVLLDAEGRPVLADFDLALHPRDFGTGPLFVGTISYMSPEQARREGHRVDARTDIYSLGVVLYEMLTGRRPFESEQSDDLLEQIKTRDPVPPRQLEPAVPLELGRICLKAMARLPSQRHASARALAEDLRTWQASGRQQDEVSETATSAVPAGRQIVPRGLRAFGAGDADFFLELLPGPRDRVGLPDSIRFWKDRLDSTDPDIAFRVGMMLGPPGSGKSSLLRAGILPRLGGQVCAVRIDCTPDETERRLAERLRPHTPGLPADADLAERIGRLRLGEGTTPGKKLILVFDQFEQWLHAHAEYAETPLVAALRQCDGVHVQAVLLVRDDFGLAAARFLHELEVPIVEGANFATVQRFTPAHARKVLASFGQAYGTLPAPPAALTSEHESFLDQAVAGLSEEGLVVPVRLVLLAEAMRARPWTPAALREMGGATGSAVVFLEESLGNRALNPAHRPYHAPACALLQALLPARGEKLKGVKRSIAALRAAAALDGHADDFDALLKLLAGELRLISPVEKEDDATTRANQPADFYQLTHDYLVSPLRQWLTQQQRATPRGRAHLRLVEFADDWNALPEARRLPGMWTWASIGLLTHRQDWTGPQRAMMRAATRHHLLRTAFAALAAMLLLLGWRQQRLQEAAALAAQHAADQVAQLRSAPIRNVPEIIEALESDWAEAEPSLWAALQETSEHPRQQRNLRLALLRVDPELATPLVAEMLSSRPDELLIFRQLLLPQRASLTPDLWRIAEAPAHEAEQRLHAAGALAAFDPESPRWARIADPVARTLLEQRPLELITWLEVFRPVRLTLLQPLSRLFHTPQDSQHRHRMRLPAVVLADYASDQPALLTDLLLDATPEQYHLIWPPFSKYGAQERGRLHQELNRPDAAADDEVRAEAGRRQAQAAVILLQLGDDKHVWPLLRLRPNRTVRSNLIHLLPALGTDPRLLVARWRQENDPGARHALILSLGEGTPDDLASQTRAALVAEWLTLYRNDPDPGLHGAIDWALRRRWHHEAEVRAIDAELAGKARAERRWFVNASGQTFVVVPGPVTLPGTRKPATRIPRSFAVGIRTVTVGEYAHFQQAHPEYRYPDFPEKYIDGADSPMIWLTWFDAAAYCRWLSEQEGVPEEEMCYPPLPRIKPGMKLPPNYLSRTGYRLPTADEWRYAVRAGTTTPRFFGFGDALVDQFGWYAGNARARVHLVGSLKPNGLGLFDAYGNVWQWSQDRAFRPDAPEDREDALGVEDREPRLILGGSFTDQAFELSSISFGPRRPTECHVNYGMRLARTVR